MTAAATTAPTLAMREHRNLLPLSDEDVRVNMDHRIYPSHREMNAFRFA
jgi:hypothetical protein